MGKGYLIVELRMGEDVLPVAGAKVLVKSKEGKVLYELTTDGNGNTKEIMLDAPDAAVTYKPVPVGESFEAYDVEVPQVGNYKKIIIHGVQIFDKQQSILPIKMYPIIPGESTTDEIYIPPEHGADMPKAQEGAIEIMQERTLPVNNVYIPTYMTVHLGTPNAIANNVRVPFIDYIKVICC